MIKVCLRVKNIRKYYINEKSLQKEERKKIEEKIKELKEKIKKLRTSYGTSQNGIARKIGCDSSTMSLYMTGKRNPSPKVREKIMKVFPNYTWDQLFKIKE